MPTIPKIADQQDPVLFLVQRKFPEISWRDLYAPKEGVRIAGVTRLARLLEAQAYEAHLRAQSREQIDQLVGSEKALRVIELQREREREESTRLYNRPEAKADVGHWAQKAYWTIDEAVALSFGKDPRHVTWANLESCTKIWTFAKDFEDRRDTFNRAVFMGQLWPRTMPGMVIAWARRVGISMPADLIEEMQRLGLQVADWKTLYDDRSEDLRRANVRIASLEEASTHREPPPGPERDIDAGELRTRERGTLLKLVLGLAIEAYRYDPKALRSTVPKDVADDLTRRGLSISDETVRKYLKEAGELWAIEDFVAEA